MNVGIFVYNFPHWKTQVGIQNLIMGGFKPKLALAADPVPLNFYKSKVRTGPKDLFLWEPREICERHDIAYEVVQHNSSQTAQLVKDYDLDVGVILGARILKPIAFDNFKHGVINMHPGILPENRGLDNLKWAIMKDLPQGVTAHLIDSKIDRGLMILREEISVYGDDTLIDLQIRLQNLEQKLMLQSLKLLESDTATLTPLAQGSYHKSLPPEEEAKLLNYFETYKSRRSKRTNT